MIGSFGVLPDQNMLTNKELIVIVQSRLPSFSIRQSCRETWGTLGNCDNILFQKKLVFKSSIQTQKHVTGIFKHHENFKDQKFEVKFSSSITPKQLKGLR